MTQSYDVTLTYQQVSPGSCLITNESQFEIHVVFGTPSGTNAPKHTLFARDSITWLGSDPVYVKGPNGGKVSVSGI